MGTYDGSYELQKSAGADAFCGKDRTCAVRRKHKITALAPLTLAAQDASGATHA